MKIADAVLSRTLTTRGASTRQRIIEEAAVLVYAKGVESVSLDEVLAAAHVSKSQLYHYFADKDALIGEVVAAQTARVLAAQEPALAQIDSIAALHRWRDAILALYERTGRTGGCPLGSLANTLANQSEPTRTRLISGFNEWVDRLGEGFVKMQEKGELPPSATTRDLALAVIGAVQGGLLLAKTLRERKPLELSLDMAVALVENQCHPNIAKSALLPRHRAKKLAQRGKAGRASRLR